MTPSTRDPRDPQYQRYLRAVAGAQRVLQERQVVENLESGQTVQLYLCYIGDGYLYGVSDNDAARSPSYWAGVDEGMDIVQATFPAAIAEDLLSFTNSEASPSIGDGYEAADLAAKHMQNDTVIYSSENEAEDDMMESARMTEHTGRSARVIFDNGGGITLQLPGFAHYYHDDARQVALDLNHFFNGDNPGEWDGNEIDSFVEPTSEEIHNGGYKVFTVGSLEDAEGQMADDSSWRNVEELLSYISPLLSSEQSPAPRWNESVTHVQQQLSSIDPAEFEARMNAAKNFKQLSAVLDDYGIDINLSKQGDTYQWQIAGDPKMSANGRGFQKARAFITSQLKRDMVPPGERVNENAEAQEEAQFSDSLQESTEGNNRWEVIWLDVWGNAEEGFEVNDAHHTGRFVELPPEVAMGITEEEEQQLVDILIAAGELRRDVKAHQIEVEDLGENDIGINDAETGEPLFQLQRVVETQSAEKAGEKVQEKLARQVMEIRMLAGGKFGIFDKSMRGAEPLAKANSWHEARMKINSMMRDAQKPLKD